jgi:MFS family permease
MLIVGRFIAGVSIGVLSMIVPVYQAEISPPVRLKKGSSGRQLTISTHEDCSLVGRSS